MKSPTRKIIKGHYTLLVGLVCFVFLVLFFAALLILPIFFALSVMRILVITERNLPIGIILMMGTCVLTGTALTAFAGRLPLKPFRTLEKATQEIAAGNFDVRLPEDGPLEIKRVCASFNAMAQELGSIETLRTDFVSNISHEFKTPIVSIRGFAKLLKRGDLAPAQRDEYLDIIIAESDRLAKMSSNVLLLSKLERDEEIRERAVFSLDEQIRRTVLLMEHSFDDKDLQLNIDLEPVMIEGSEELLQQVWINLLGNAVKFSETGGTITMTLIGDGEQAIVTVSDTGIGMDEDTLNHLFDKFYQGDKSHATEGNGLGLSLVKRIVELGGGSIDVSSRAGIGSNFIVTLPLAGESDEMAV